MIVLRHWSLLFLNQLLMQTYDTADFRSPIPLPVRRGISPLACYTRTWQGAMGKGSRIGEGDRIGSDLYQAFALTGIAAIFQKFETV